MGVAHAGGRSDSMVNAFDVAIIEALNVFARRSELFDTLVVLQARLSFFKSGVVLALLWWSWALPKPDRSRVEVAARSLAGIFIGILIGRALQNFMPPRARPLHEPSLDFVPPHGVEQSTLRDFSAFPSDHALLFFAVATAIWASSRPLGLLAFAWAAVMISLPRIYTGYHYATDILAGAAIGILVMAVVLRMPVPGGQWLRRRLPRAADLPGWAYAIAFLVTYQAAILFDDLRVMAEFGVDVLRGATGMLN